MQYNVEIVLRERDYAVTEEVHHHGNPPAEWTEIDVEGVLKSMLLAIDRVKNPGDEPRQVRLRGFSWIVEPTDRRRGHRDGDPERRRRRRALRHRPAPPRRPDHPRARRGARAEDRRALSVRRDQKGKTGYGIAGGLPSRSRCFAGVLTQRALGITLARRPVTLEVYVYDGIMKLPYRVLVLEDDENALAGIVELLSESGYEVTPASAYEYAKRMLSEGSYDLFVTDVRLRSYNGLHLVKKVRQDWPDTAVIIMTGYDEPLMQLEASRYSARFIKKPIKSAELLEAVRQSVVERAARAALAAEARHRRLPREGRRARPPRSSTSATAGCASRFPPTDAVPALFDVEVSGINLHLMVEPVWSSRTVPGAILCGAALASDSTPAARTWREIVDRLSA